jgi:hypothetical protein
LREAPIMLLPFVIFAVGFAGLVLWVLRKDRASRAERGRELSELGFRPCGPESHTLVERVTRLENNSEYRYKVQAPLCLSLGEKAVYHYTKERRRQGNIVAVEELLFPLERPAPDGLVLFYKPSSLRRGTTTTLISHVATGAWDARPDDVVPLDIPIDLQQGNLIGALAPAGASLYELIDPKTLAQLEPVADFGVLAVSCRGDDCALTSAGSRSPLDLARLWPVVRQLTG